MHQARLGPPRDDLTLHGSVGAIDASEWDRLAGENAFATHGWLLTIETSWRANVQPLYFALRRNGTLAAVSVCYLAHATPGIETLDDLLFGRAAAIARIVGASFLPALVVGPALGYGWHIGVDATLSGREANEARALMLDAIGAEADARQLRVSFVHVLDEERELKALLEARGYLRCRNVPVAVLELRWSSFDDYLADLPRKSRREFRRQINRHREGGTVIDMVGCRSGDEARLMGLLDQNARKHGGLRFACGQGFFSGLEGGLGEHARVFTSRKSGLVTGVCVMLVQDATAFPLAIGIDPLAADGDYTYFELCYNALIANAIVSGIRRMYYGRGMYEVKVRRGCELADTWIYARPEGPRRMGSAVWFALASRWNRYKLSPQVRRAVRRPAATPP